MVGKQKNHSRSMEEIKEKSDKALQEGDKKMDELLDENQSEEAAQDEEIRI